MRSLVSVGAVAALTVATATAAANTSGVAGYTGKPNAAAPQGESCSTNCHRGGTAPSAVTINGPDTLAAGQSAEYTLVVSTNAARVGAGIAATDGVALANVSGLRDSFGELVQDRPLAPSGGQVTFRFRVTAPMTGTAIKLWAVGLAANNDGNTGGDAARQTTKDITITGGNPPGGSSSGGTSSGGSSSGEGSSGSTSSSSGGGDDDPDTGSGASSTSSSGSAGGDDELGADPDDDDDGTSPSKPRTRRSSPNAGEGSCSAAPGVSVTSFSAAVVGLALATLLGRRRGRRGGEDRK